MKQDGTAGTPRPVRGPPKNEPVEFEFSDEKHAFAYIRGRGRTEEQLAALTAAAEAGLAIADLITALRDHLWVVRPRGLLRRPVTTLPSIATQLARSPPKASARSLAAPFALANIAVDVVASTSQAVAAATRLNEVLSRNRGLERSLTRWSKSRQLMTALVVHVAEREALKPEVGPRELEAISLVIGRRNIGDEFGQGALRREDAWRQLLRKVKKTVVPQLRALELA